jgi:hypothetical protein
VLIASLSGGALPAGGGFDPVVVYETLAITIADPYLTPHTVTVAGEATFNGSTTANGQATFGGLTTVNGPAILNGTTTANGPLTAGALTVQGSLTATGAAVQMLTDSHTSFLFESPGSMGTTPQTDGFVVGTISPANGGCYGLITATTSIGQASAAGGNMVTNLNFNIQGTSVSITWTSPLTGSITLPVRKGDDLTMAVASLDQSQSNVYATFKFFPLGRNTGGATLEAVPNARPLSEVIDPSLVEAHRHVPTVTVTEKSVIA